MAEHIDGARFKLAEYRFQVWLPITSKDEEAESLLDDIADAAQNAFDIFVEYIDSVMEENDIPAYDVESPDTQ